MLISIVSHLHIIILLHEFVVNSHNANNMYRDLYLLFIDYAYRHGDDERVLCFYDIVYVVHLCTDHF